jgi:dCTP deaminase
MSVLSDVSLRARIGAGRLVVDPLAADAIQPASIDVRLGDGLRIWNGHDHGHGHVDLRRDQADAWDACRLIADDDMAKEGGPYWWLWPGNLYLGATLERVEVPDDLLCHLHGRSSLGRLGVVIHQTAGLVDPGWRGRLTLEIAVAFPTILRPGQPIGQLTFERLTTPAERPYGGRYQDDAGPTPSRLGVPTGGAS